ncbi:unnamed protein product [Cuscuta campestris]|uniref:DUF4283 domain-containing protein n=1 Tax=Cuscuta campestris TaxID=132261 RepID=A0A484K1C1_9ASTE|nr:unnamed protein product [Cuscuta campestris]
MKPTPTPSQSILEVDPSTAQKGEEEQSKGEEQDKDEQEQVTLDPLKAKSYAEIVGDKEELDCKLSFIDTVERNGHKTANLTQKDIVEHTSYWEAAILVCILGANPPIGIVEGFVHRIWKQYSIQDVTLMKPGQFVVRFEKVEDQEEILKRNYYYFDNKPAYVRKWQPCSKVNLDALIDIPIWIQLPDLEIKFWTKTWLSKIGSSIGKPIRAVKTTISRTKLNFARIQIEVSTNQQLPEEIQFEDDKGKIMSQQIQYEWCPTKCTHCKGLGHQEKSCKKKT